MFAVEIQSEKFQGLSTLAQHKLINQILKDEIEKMHGIQLFTSVPRKV